MTHPFAGAHVGLIRIPVRDFAAARAFYRDVLGLEEEFAIDEYGWAQYAGGSVPICLWVPPGGIPAPGGETGIQLRVQDARSAFAHAGPHAASELSEGDDGALSFSLRDPDGNVLQVLQMA